MSLADELDAAIQKAVAAKELCEDAGNFADICRAQGVVAGLQQAKHIALTHFEDKTKGDELSE